MTTRIPVLFMTKEMPGREEYAVRTIQALQGYFHMRPEFEWFIADGNSSEAYKDKLREAIWHDHLIHFYSSDESPGVVWTGALKLLFSMGHQWYLRLEDDFEMRKTNPLWFIDVEKYTNILNTHPDIGMIRLGLMPINLEMHTVGIDGEIFFDIHHNRQYSYSGNPGLVHKRLHDAVGYFHTTQNPGDIEIDFDNKVRYHNKLRILWPLLIGRYGTYGPFNHIGEVQSYD